MRMEDKSGSIEVGKYADLMVLEKNQLSVIHNPISLIISNADEITGPPRGHHQWKDRTMNSAFSSELTEKISELHTTPIYRNLTGGTVGERLAIVSSYGSIKNCPKDDGILNKP